MRRAYELDIKEIEKYYTITDDGRVWTKIKNRWLKPHDNMYGYISYSINKGVDHPVTVFAHTLVALKYIGQPPTLKHEIDHKDTDKANNLYTNLQWMTHSQNQLKAYAQGRTNYWIGRSRGTPDIITRMLMANAKKKPVKYVLDGQETVFDSIEDAATGLSTYRKKVYLCLNTGRLYQGGLLQYVVGIPPTI
jgi:hypothetical protein